MQSLRSPIRGAAKRRRFGVDLNNKRTKAYRQHAEDVHVALKQWQKHLNSVNTDPAPIFVENTVDLEGPPQVKYLSVCRPWPLRPLQVKCLPVCRPWGTTTGEVFVCLSTLRDRTTTGEVFACLSTLRDHHRWSVCLFVDLEGPDHHKWSICLFVDLEGPPQVKCWS